MAIATGMEKRNRDIGWRDLVRLRCVPPALRFVQRCLHRKWLLKPPRIGLNMHKFSQHLRRDRHPVPFARAAPRASAEPLRDACAPRSPRPGGSLYPSHASRPAFQHLAIPLVACPNRFENLADAYRIGVPQTGFLRMFFFAPRFADDPLQLRQLSAENCETDFSISASAVTGER